MFKDFYLKIKPVINDFKQPQRATGSDAGIDVFVPEDTIIPAGEDIKVDLGFKTEFPKGYEMRFDNKSGNATKRLLEIGACLIDPSYRGNIICHVYNRGTEDVFLSKGASIAQFVVRPVWNGQPEIVSSIDMETERGESGFGEMTKKNLE